MWNNILVVDDEPMLVEMISRCLTAKGYRVTTANYGGKASSFLTLLRFDVVLCDIHMPGTDGFAVLRACKELQPQTKVILCSGDTVSETVNKAFACGADGFLAKPFLLGELLNQISRCLPLIQPEIQNIMAAADPRDTMPLTQESFFSPDPLTEPGGL
jgi:CheY-like chemotaxis protein